MKTHTKRKLTTKRQSVSEGTTQKLSSSESTFQFMDNRNYIITQRKVNAALNKYIPRDQPSNWHKSGQAGSSKPIVQRKLKVDIANPAYLKKVSQHLNELVGESGKVIVNPKTGVVSFLKKRPSAKKVEPTAGHRLIKSLVNHSHTTTIQEAHGVDALSSQPVLPNNTVFGKAIDLVKGSQFMRRRGYLTHEARAFVNGATPGVGVGTIVHYDANLSNKDRESLVTRKDGSIKRETSPHSIGLGHELIHSDHFHHGLAAYDEKGTPIVALRPHTHKPNTRGEPTNLEEINTVGLKLLSPTHPQYNAILPDNRQKTLSDKDRRARRITEQDLRRQMKLNLRAGYER